MKIAIIKQGDTEINTTNVKIPNSVSFNKEDDSMTFCVQGMNLTSDVMVSICLTAEDIDDICEMKDKE